MSRRRADRRPRRFKIVVILVLVIAAMVAGLAMWRRSTTRPLTVQAPMPSFNEACASPDRLAAVCAELQQPAPPPLDDLDPAAARAIFDALAEVYHKPNDADTIGRLGMVYQAHRMATHAGTAYDRAGALDRSNPRWAHHRGYMAMKAGAAELAVDEFERALSLDPSLIICELYLGRLRHERGELDAAQAHYGAYVARRPRDPFGHTGLARVARDRGATASAIAHLEKALGCSPALAEAAYMLGLCYRQQGDHARAEAMLEKSRRLPEKTLPPDPLREDVEALVTTLAAAKERAREAMTRGDLDTALNIARKMTTRAPLDNETWLRLAKVYREMDRLPEALTAAERAVEHNPESVRALVWLATIQHAQGRLVDAQATADRALELNPGSADAWIVKGHALIGLQRYEPAVECLRRVTEFRPRVSIHWRTLGALLFEQGDIVGARESLLRAQALKPDDPVTTQLLHSLPRQGGNR